VIGSTSDEVFDADGTLGGGVQIDPLSDLRKLVLANHPALSEAETTTTRSRALVNLEKARRIPQPVFMGEYEQQPDINFYRFGVSIPIPLWDRRKGPIAEAQAEVQRSEALARQQRLEIIAALERAYDQYQISNEQVEGLQSGSLLEAEAAVEAARSAYKFGERGIVEVLDAQRVLQGVRSDLLDALFARQSALIDLQELGATH
jgi:cobalt-zinc-cadmium efflux system outer membrane protein